MTKITIIPSLVRVAILAVAANFAGVASAAADQEEKYGEIGPAQKLMLSRPHLKNVSDNTTLRYSFMRKSSAKDSFEDVIDMQIGEKNGEGTRDLRFEFFTGDRRRPYPALTKMRTNGIVQHFMTRDVWAMARDLGSGAQQAGYFSRKVFVAIREKAKVDEISIDNGDGKSKAKRVTVTPFVKDANARKFPRYVNKSYEFVFSPDVPGELYMIRTFVPEYEAKQKAPIEEIVKFDKKIAQN